MNSNEEMKSDLPHGIIDSTKMVEEASATVQKSIHEWMRTMEEAKDEPMEEAKVEPMEEAKDEQIEESKEESAPPITLEQKT